MGASREPRRVLRTRRFYGPKRSPVIRALVKTEFAQAFRLQILGLPVGVVREFDVVSAEGTVVVSIKTSSGLTSDGNTQAERDNGCIASLLLEPLGAPVRGLVTIPEFYESSSSAWRGLPGWRGR